MNENSPTTNGPDDADVPALSAKALRDLTATAYHESGHAVMAAIVGRPIQKVTISPAQLQTGGIRLGACKFKKGQANPSFDWLEAEVMVLFAGMVAESHFTEKYCHQGASQDIRVARKLIATRAKNERQIEKLERRLFDKTEHVLAEDAHEKAIKLVADELVEKVTISGRAVAHFLRTAIAQTN